MSFSISFTTTLEDAKQRIESEHAPECVKEFVRKSLGHLSCAQVCVYGYGHLCDSAEAYKVSSCNLTITPLDAEGRPV